MTDDYLEMSGVNSLICPECGKPMVLRITTRYTYKDGTPRKFYGCTGYPECTATHGANPDGSPLGIPANKETKEARIAAHAAFDPLWKNGILTRPQAYEWLKEQLDQPDDVPAHIGAMTIEGCQSVIDICNFADIVEIQAWREEYELENSDFEDDEWMLDPELGDK